MRTLKALDIAAGLEAVAYVTQQAVSGAGKSGVDELDEQLRDVNAQPKVFPDRIAHNVLPQRGALVGRHTEEELKLIFESRKILALGDLLVSATCTSVDVYVGHTLAVEARFRDKISPEKAENIVRNTPGVILSDMPTPQRAAGGDVTLVGRVRQSGIFGEHGLSLYFAGDNIREGAALNTVLIAEQLLRR
jgi:aspartate-semialdehyde dehydrogenase